MHKYQRSKNSLLLNRQDNREEKENRPKPPNQHHPHAPHHNHHHQELPDPQHQQTNILKVNQQLQARVEHGNANDLKEDPMSLRMHAANIYIRLQALASKTWKKYGK